MICPTIDMNMQQYNYNLYKQLYDQTKDNNKRYGFTIISLMKQVTGSEYGHGLEEVLGASYYTYLLLNKLIKDYPINYEILRKHQGVATSSIIKFDDSIDWSDSYNELQEFIANVEKQNSIQQVCIMILQKKINDIQQSVDDKNVHNQKKIKEIEDMAKELHNVDLIKEHTVNHLYNDGELISQKGGDIYLMRSTFSIQPSLILPKMSFPEDDWNGYSYAILSDADCQSIRQKMIELTI
jgi:hypothetical protein